jgi:hypothetical protein
MLKNTDPPLWKDLQFTDCENIPEPDYVADRLTTSDTHKDVKNLCCRNLAPGNYTYTYKTWGEQTEPKNATFDNCAVQSDGQVHIIDESKIASVTCGGHQSLFRMIK